ncbi:response regulator [Marispirochaeta aestuarii]|uniref:response regulator n=1 Tax=Marispirochaeta aestuarii TaxID=1963862 RepID=UPI0029C840DA|nr:response regulator [Marispirochaeta aestuarii]
MNKVLIVDDSMISRQMLSKYLAPTGYTIDTAASGEEALEKILPGSCDVVVLDLLMPGISGLEVLEKLSLEKLTPPVIVLSADIQDSTREKALSLGASRFMTKPPRPEELQKLVRELMESKE